MLRPLGLMPRPAGGIGEVEQGGGQCAADGVEEQVEARIHEAPDVRAGIYSGYEELDRLVYRTETEPAEQSENGARTARPCMTTSPSTSQHAAVANLNPNACTI